MADDAYKLISLQMDKSALDKAKKRAKELGLTLSAYIRLCVLTELKSSEVNSSNTFRV